MITAREMAISILQQLPAGRETLDQLLSDAEARINQLNRPDRGLFHALVYGTLRHQSQLDQIIDQHARRSSKKIDPLVRLLLRIGVFQIRFMDRIPESAAVNAAVELAKRLDRKWATGFVNGLLRNVARDDSPPPLPHREDDPVGFLAASQSFPPWIIRRWLERWDFDRTEAMCRAINAVPPITMRANTLKASRDTLIQSISERSGKLEPCAFCPDGVHAAALHRSLSQWEAFQRGLFQVQGEAAQLVSLLADPRPGQIVWDACAGLGTKTAHLAQLMHNRGFILATDRHPGKLKRLNEEMARLGIEIVQTRPMDLLSNGDDLDAGPFDRILLDAPCSGLGVLQRNPDGKWNTRIDDLRRHQLRQETLIHRAGGHLKSGGILVYAVCSLEPEENETIIQGFLQKHPEFDIFSPDPAVSAIDRRLLTPEGFLKTFPHPHGMDGFFAAALTRR
jgi:16S rRNA (cytosine967-C5)-methyltransferase